MNDNNNFILELVFKQRNFFIDRKHKEVFNWKNGSSLITA